MSNTPLRRDAQRLLVLVEEAVRRFPRYHKYTLGSDMRRHLRQRGVAHMFIAEEGRLPGGLKRRVLRQARWPRQPEGPAWPPTRGV